MNINNYSVTELTEVETINISGGGYIRYWLGWAKELGIAAGEAIADAACAVGRACSESINSLPLNHL